MFETIEYLTELAGNLIDKLTVPFVGEAFLLIAVAIALGFGDRAIRR